MRYKFLDRSLTLLMLIGSVLFILWIVMGYGPEGITSEGTRQRAARVQ